MKTAPKRTYNITSVQRCLRLLRLFSEAPGGLTASEVTRISGLPVSTVHRFLANLETAGFLEWSQSGKYHLGIASFSIGHVALGQLSVRRLSLPYLRALSQYTQETIHLTVRQGLTAVYVEKLDSPQQVKIHSRIGASVPLHCTAVGKVLLAYLPQGELQTLLPRMELRRFAQNTIGTPQELQQQLDRVRKVGHAYDLEEHEPRIRCIAAPIWDQTGAVQASLSITAPAERMPIPRLRNLAPVIQEAGLQISRDLGYQQPSRVPPNSEPSPTVPGAARQRGVSVEFH
jgi:IclR family acetate operon transcriptional repressor